jgi:uncharacterized FlgJ-related protein
MLKLFFDKQTVLLYMITIIGLLSIVTLVSFIEQPKVVYVTQKDKVYMVEYRDKPDKFTEEKLIEYLKELNVKYPEVVYAQAVIESGGFKSGLFKSQNNIFGMKKAKQRPTLALKSSGTYASFKNWRESVIDYVLYQSRFIHKISNREEYINHLAKNYATSGNYKRHLVELINKLNIQ